MKFVLLAILFCSPLFSQTIVISGNAAGTAGGDLSGQYPNPTVVNINGAAVPASQSCLGSNSLSQLITGTCTGGGGSMVYPAAGLPVSTGTAWGTSKTTPTGTIVGTTDTQTLTNKTLDGVSAATMVFLDPTSSIQTQLNSKLAANATGLNGTTIPTSATLLTTTTGLQVSNNLSDVTAATARTNLGLGTASQSSTSAFDAAGAATTAQTNAETFSAIATNITSGTILAARLPAFTGDATTTIGTVATTVKGINGVTLSTLSTGLLKITTSTGVPSIAVAGTDYLLPTGSATGLSKASASAFGVSECDGTTITCSGGIFTAVSGGTGTVTHTAGSLTLNHLMLGNAAADTKVDSGCTTDGAGNLSCLSYSLNGTTQGIEAFAVGTGTITGTLPTAYVGIIGPPSGTAAYFLQLPIVAPTAGQVLSFAAPATSNGVSQAVGTWVTPATGGAGTVTSIATTGPISGGTITGSGTISCPTCTVTVASGTSALGTTAIAAGTPCTTITTAATGVASTDAISWNPNASIKAVTGYVPATTGGLSISAYPTSGNVNFDVCNWTSASITPGAVTLNWRVTR